MSRGSSALREAARRRVPYGLRARVMRTARRLVLGSQAPAREVVLAGIDLPADGAVLPGGVVSLIGWAIRDGRMPHRVDVRLDGVLLGRARLGLARPDLPFLGPDTIAAGFELRAPVPAEVAGPLATLTAVAHFAGGHRQVVTGPVVQLRPRREAVARPFPRERGRQPVAQPRDDARPHVLAVTHQLDLGGGQLYLQDLLRGLARRGDLRISVASCSDGPLRAELEDLGISVHLLGAWPFQNAEGFESRLDELAAWMRQRRIDGVVANTIASFPAVHVATQLSLPALWTIHESYELPVLWQGIFGDNGEPYIVAVARDTLTTADRLIFEAEATRRLYVPAAGEERCLLVPYGIELEALDAARAGMDRARARSRLGIAPGARVLLCVGTFEMRKAQSLLVRAFADVADRHPGAHLVLVGDNGTEYARAVRRLAEGTGLGPRIRVEAVTPDVITWYLAADVLVSASDVESMPRSALEAMALGTPVLAADVYGLAELVEDGVTGWLVGARDLDALRTGLERVLAAPREQLHRIGRAAAARVRRDHDASGFVAAVAGLLAELLPSRAEESNARGPA